MKIKLKRERQERYAILSRIGISVGIGAIVLSLLPFGSISAETSVRPIRADQEKSKDMTEEMRDRLDSRIDPRLRANVTASTSAKRVPPPRLVKNASTTASSTRPKKLEDRDQGKGQGNGAICSRIISSEAQIIANLTKSVRDKSGARKENILKNREDKDNKLEERRDAHDDNKEIRYEKLEANAKTDAQIAAVAKFKTTMEAAITTRRTAVDLAISTYRKDVDAIISKYPLTNPASTTASGLEAAAKDAIAKAKTACNATSTDQQVILKNFQASLEKLKNDYKSAAKSAASAQASSTAAMKAELKAAAEKRETAIKSARDAFKAVYTTAKAELRLAFGLKVDGNASSTR